MKRKILTMGIVFTLLSTLLSFAQLAPVPDPRVIYPTVGNQNTPPYDFTAYVDKRIKKTFHQTKTLAKQNLFRFQVNSNSEICYAYVFKADDPESYSKSFATAYKTGGGTEGKLNLNIPAAGDYVFLVITAGNNATDTCTIVMKNDTVSSVVSNNYFACEQGTDRIYNTFTCNTDKDPQLYIVEGENPGKIVAYNDNYLGESDYTWGNNARIRKQYTNGTSGVIVTLTEPPALPGGLPSGGFQNIWDRIISLYIGCKDAPHTKVYFSNLKLADAVRSAPNSDNYNCIAWAGGEWDHWEWPPMHFSDSHSNSNISAFDNYFASRNLIRTLPYGTGAVVDLWGQISGIDTVYTHGSVLSGSNQYALGYSWESKAGSLERIFHPRNALHSTNNTQERGYGEICWSYRKPTVADLGPTSLVDTIGIRPYVFENIQFLDDELSDIYDLAMNIPDETIDDFFSVYEEAADSLSNSATGSFDQIEIKDYYLDALDFCLSYPVTLPLLYLKLDEGDVLAVKLIDDILVADNMGVMNQVWNYMDTHTTNGAGTRIRRTLQSNATLFVKSLMNTSGMSVQQIAEECATYSNDSTILSLTVNGNDAVVNVQLDKESLVNLCLATPVDGIIGEVVKNQRLQAGQHTFEFRLPKKGAYIITCLINGRIYSKKCSVK